jgi:hypothetical protein
MTSEDLKAELEKDPFVPLRLHLVSGKVLKITWPGAAWLLQNSVLIMRNVKPGERGSDGYDVVSLRNIERIELVHGRRAKGDNRN